jgi:hypothetical protein
MLGLRRRKEPTAGEADAQTLMNAMMDFARDRLKAGSGFAPFGGSLGRDGTVAMTAERADQPEAAPEPKTARELAEEAAEQLRYRIAGGGIRAAAVASDVQFGKRDTGEMREAVQLHIEHQDGYCVDIFVPYRLRGPRWGGKGKRRVRWSHPVGQESSRMLWSG